MTHRLLSHGMSSLDFHFEFPVPLFAVFLQELEERGFVKLIDRGCIRNERLLQVPGLQRPACAPDPGVNVLFVGALLRLELQAVSQGGHCVLYRFEHVCELSPEISHLFHMPLHCSNWVMH